MPADMIQSWIRPVCRIGEASVVHIDLAPDEVREQHAVSWLHAQELQRWRRYQVDRARREFAFCRSALRYLLCQQLGCDNSELSIAAADHGKPYALLHGKPVSIRFNVSHSDPHGLITITEGGRVGVDVEAGLRKRDFDGISEMVFGPNERAEILSAKGAKKARLFFRYWTLKEALLKGFGTGLSTDLTKIEIPRNIRHGASRGIFQFPSDPAIHWQLQDLSTQQYTAAIATEIASTDLPQVSHPEC